MTALSTKDTARMPRQNADVATNLYIWAEKTCNSINTCPMEGSQRHLTAKVHGNPKQSLLQASVAHTLNKSGCRSPYPTLQASGDLAGRQHVRARHIAYPGAAVQGQVQRQLAPQRLQHRRHARLAVQREALQHRPPQQHCVRAQRQRLPEIMAQPSGLQDSAC